MAEDDVQMDFLEMDTPDPSDASAQQYSNSYAMAPDVDDTKSPQAIPSRSRGATTSHAATASRMGGSMAGPRASATVPASEMRALVKQFQVTIQELKEELAQARDENEKLMVHKETIIIEYDSKIDELNFEMDELQIESQQYQLRYSEINEQLHELRTHQADNESNGQEAQDLLAKLHNKEQNEMDLMIDLEQANKQVETLKKQIKNSNENLSKLQKAMLQIKKDKSVMEQNQNRVVQQFERLEKDSSEDIANLSSRLQQLTRENEIYRQSLSNAEMEKEEMQNNFTEATMELIHDELNEAHNDRQEDVTSLRLGRVSSSDMNRTAYAHERDDSMVESPVPNSFVKQRFGSQTSLPDTGFLETLDDSHQDYMSHLRKSSVDSRLGGYESVDPSKLKADIREIMVNDIKGIISQELAHAPLPAHQRKGTAERLAERVASLSSLNLPAANTEQQEEMLEKLNQLLELSRARRKSVDLAGQQRQNEQEQQSRLNVMIKELEQSMTTLLQKQVMETLTTSSDDRKAFQERIENVLAESGGKNGSGSGSEQFSEELKTFLTSTMQNQMTVFQIALEKEIGNAVSSNMRDVVSDGMNGNLREQIRNDFSEVFSKFSEESGEKKNAGDGSDGIDAGEADKMGRVMQEVMSGKIDGFMDEFRKEVVPEVEAVFQQLSLRASRGNGASDGMDMDDEKAGSGRNELFLRNEKLQLQIEELKKEQDEHERVLRNAATSKVHQVVKLQNLLDHMRQDNRVLQFQLQKYHTKFQEIKQKQAEPTNIAVVNQMWHYFQAPSGASRLST